MRLALFSVSYAGLWGQAALGLCEFIERAARLGYRGVLLSNTLILGAMMGVFATVAAATPIWLIVVQAFVFGFASSTQFTSMNTLVYADVAPDDTSTAELLPSSAVSARNTRSSRRRPRLA